MDLTALERLVGQDLDEVAQLARNLWHLGLVPGPSPEKPLVTVGTLAAGIVLLGLGYIAAGMFSRWFASRLLTRFHLSKSDAAPLQSLMFYLLLAMFTAISLNVLQVPITAFSFLGGALAIGAGFGSQNLVNNFISGLILLVERPVRVGDVIDLDGTTGTVSHIGARSTKISTGVNHDLIVPNSKLLETSVVNWTLSDDVVACNVTVGVAYGTPPREVERLLLRAAHQHPHVLKEPAPDVILADLGAEALQFKLRAWTNLRQTRRVQVESDLRFAIEELFTARGIVIASRQRDNNHSRPVETGGRQPQNHLKAA